MEAEAQCAAMEIEGSTEGTITDDCDIFLFGGQCVYRRVCSRTHSPEAYTATGLQRKLGLDRSRLIDLGHLLGCDYTSGVPGVGVVRAMEILADFPSDSAVVSFSSWVRSIQDEALPPPPEESKLRRSIRNSKQ